MLMKAPSKNEVQPESPSEECLSLLKQIHRIAAEHYPPLNPKAQAILKGKLLLAKRDAIRERAERI